MQIDYSKIITDLIQRNVEKVFKGVYKKGEEKYQELIIHTGTAFEEYLKSAVNKFSKTKSIIDKHRPVYIYDFYVDIDVKCGDDIINTEKVEQLLEYNKKITIFGTGGIGKSTLFKHLFLNTIRTTDLIPIFLELKNINDKSINDKEYKLEDFIYESLVDLNFSLEKELFIKSFYSGNYIMFFDAFDELNSDKKSFVHNEIERITNKYGDNYYLVSSRYNEMLERGWDNFYDFNVIPLDKEKSIQLVTNLDYDEDIKSKFLFQLTEGNLFDTHSSFCCNPLLLTLMLLTYEEFAEIPAKLHLFYEKAFYTLYAKHDASKGSFTREKRLEKKGLASDDFEYILSIFSAFSYLDSKNTFTRNQLMEYISEAKEEAKEEIGIEFNSNDFKIDLTEAVCILIQDGINYRYQHRSFQEYFTALYICKLGDEARQEFLMELFEEQPDSINEDTVFDMLYDMGRSKLERDFLIPALNELKDLIIDPDEEVMAFKFLNLIGSKLRFIADTKMVEGQVIHDVRARLVYSKPLNTYNSRYRYLVEFIAAKYNDYYKHIPQSDFITTSDKRKAAKEMYERMAGKDAYSESRSMFNYRLNINTFTKVDVKDVVLIDTVMIRKLRNSLWVLEMLREKYANKKTRKRRSKVK
ncbi:NACHT domain-containing protein [Priestia megaterium]